MIPVTAVRLLVSGCLPGELLDFTTSGRAPVEPTFGAKSRPWLATLLGKCHFATLAAEDDVSAEERRTTAQDRTFVQAANGTFCGDPFLAALLAALNLAAETTDRDLRLGMVLVRDADNFFLAAAGCQHREGQTYKRQA
jgi:hypothetical protein